MKITRRHYLKGLLGLSLLGSGLLSGCGFRLRGTGKLAQASYKTVFVMGADKVPVDLKNVLYQQWQGLGIEIVESISAAEIAVQLGAYDRNVSRTSFSSSGETTSELIKLTQDFMAFRVADEVEILNTQVMAFRDRQIDPAQQLAATRELQNIERQMQQDLGYQLIDQLNRAYRKLTMSSEAAEKTESVDATTPNNESTVGQ